MNIPVRKSYYHFRPLPDSLADILAPPPPEAPPSSWANYHNCLDEMTNLTLQSIDWDNNNLNIKGRYRGCDLLWVIHMYGPGAYTVSHSHRSDMPEALLPDEAQHLYLYPFLCTLAAIAHDMPTTQEETDAED